MGNIFAVEPKQLYTESPTSDKYAKVGLGGIPGAILAVGILAGVFFGVQTLGSFEEVNNEFAGYDGVVRFVLLGEIFLLIPRL